MPVQAMAESAALAPTSLAPTASVQTDGQQTAGGAAAPAAAAPAGAVPGAAQSQLPPLLLAKSASIVASIVARVASPTAIRERIGAVYNSGIAKGPADANANASDAADAATASPCPNDAPALVVALRGAQREIVRLRDEVAALLASASGRGTREGQVAVQALARARHDSVAGAAAREQAGRDLASLVDGCDS
jgi:hypothetical protein